MSLLKKTEAKGKSEKKSNISIFNGLSEGIDSPLLLAVVAQLKHLAGRSAEGGESLVHLPDTTTLVACEDSHHVAGIGRKGNAIGQGHNEFLLYRKLLEAAQQRWHEVLFVAIGKLRSEHRLALYGKQAVQFGTIVAQLEGDSTVNSLAWSAVSSLMTVTSPTCSPLA